MERSLSSTPHPSTAMRIAGGAALNLLLPAATGKCGESPPAPRTRPAVPEVSVLRQPQDGRRTESEPQAHPTAHAPSGDRSSLSQTQLEPAGAGPPGLPVSATRRFDRAAPPSLEYRYYLYSDARWLPVPGRRDGLVQPLRAQLGTLQYPGDRFLPGGAGGRLPLRPARNLELRSGFAVYFGRIPRAAQTAWHLHQHGWPRSRARQCFHRTAVALAQIRAHLSRRLRHRPRTVPGARELLPLLQLPTSAPGARLSNAGRPVSTPKEKEEVILIMGAPPPNPWDLSLFSSRMDTFLFTGIESCRTIEMLDRRIGQRRDATRAPTQARNGWRPHGRLLKSARCTI